MKSIAAALLLALAATARAQELEAKRVRTPPVLDGRDNDAAWREAPSTSAFTVFRPTEGAAPAFRTEVRVTYDTRMLYVLVRAFDPHPDSIVGVLTRRDNVVPPSDAIRLDIDSYDDGRNGFEYTVNPVGVKSDLIMFDDDRVDYSWDGIWNVATKIDSLGWVAEYAIPFSQLRFRNRPGIASTFGIMVSRLIGRTGERSSWPAYRPSQSGYVSQFTRLTGLSDLPGGVRLEAAPYLLARGHNTPGATGSGITSTVTGGADFKFGPRPNVTIDATLNPDFGQVESDPAVLNLSSQETFLAEKRPFFLEGATLFKFTLSRDPSSPEGLFYTRRIGRGPSLSGSYGDANTPNETTILGAAKLTSRFGGNNSIASLAAVTGEELGAPRVGGGRYVVEPRAMYSITRIQREYRGGRSGFGLMFTGMKRSLDSLSGTLLPSQALSGGFLTQNQSRDGRYLARMWLVASRVEGTPAAMTRLQTSLPHAFQRPDDHNALDTTATSLSGNGGQVLLAKVGGTLRYGASIRYFSPGFDPADVGFIKEANHTSVTQDFGFQASRATRWYRTAQGSIIHITWWSGSGRIDDMINTSATFELPSQWTLLWVGNVNRLFGTVCSQECTRGGPAIRKDPATSTSVELLGDARYSLQPDLLFAYSTDDGGRSHAFRVAPGISWRAAGNLQVGLATTVENLDVANQFYKRFGSAISDTTHTTVARLVQATRALTARVSYAATPTLTVQWYAQPFIAKGDYSNVRELSSTPRSATYSLRTKPYSDAAVTSAPGGTNFRQFRSNLVTRWEYRPGSVLYVVWTQGRDLSNNQPGTLELGRDARELFALAPRNTIAIKASYWLGR